MSTRVRVLGPAHRDLKEARDWLAQYSVDAARRFVLEFAHAKTQIRNGPLSFGVAFHNARRNLPIRIFVFRISPRRAYAIYYAVIGREARVLRVRGPGQQELSSDDFDFGRT